MFLVSLHDLGWYIFDLKLFLWTFLLRRAFILVLLRFSSASTCQSVRCGLMQMDLMREGGGGVQLRPVKAAQRRMKPKEKERFDERVHEPLPWNDFDAAALLDFSKSFQSEWIKLTVNGVISWCCEAKKYIYISTLQQLFSQMKLAGKKCFWAWHCNYTCRPVFQIQKRQSSLTLIKHDRCRRDITVCRQVSMDWEEIEPRSQQLTLRWVVTHLTL